MRPILAIAMLLAFMWPGIYLGAQEMQDTSLQAPAATPSKWMVKGYLKDLQTVQFKKIADPWALDNLIHNRIDLSWYPNGKLQLQLGVRNRLLYGVSAPLYAQNDDLLSADRGVLKLSKTLFTGDSYVLHTAIDRANVGFTAGKWQFTLGRQRINWGMNLVWNPNDIFNAYSWFDFDYEERPGSDALRVQYYTSSTASAELAFMPGKKINESVTAALYRFNKAGYDVQFLAARSHADWVVGGGWSGVLGKAGFNGEVSVFVPSADANALKTVVSGSIGINYTFQNSLYLHGAYLLNSAGLRKGDAINTVVLLQNVSAKSLMPSRHTMFAEVGYQLTPLLRADLSGILNPADGSFFTGPFLTASVTDNIQLLAAGQLFFGANNSLYGPYGKLWYLRLKWSF